MNLYDIAGEYVGLLARLESVDEDGVVVTDEDVAAELDGLQVTLENKLEACARVCRNLEAEAEAYSAEAARFTVKAKTRLNSVGRLKDYMVRAMEATGLDKVKGQLLEVRLLAGKPRVEVTDVDVLPLELCRRKVEADKVAIKKQLDDGVDVPGAKLVQGPPSLRIK